MQQQQQHNTEKEKLPKYHVFHSDGNGGYGLTKVGRIYVHIGIVVTALIGGGGGWKALDFWSELNYAVDQVARTDIRVAQTEQQVQNNKVALANTKVELLAEINSLRVAIAELRTIIHERTRPLPRAENPHDRKQMAQLHD